MRRQRSIIALLLVYLGLVYNLSFLGLDQVGPIHFSDVFYYLIPFPALIIVLYPPSRRLPFVVQYAGWAILLMVLRSLTGAVPLFDGMSTYVTIAELALLAVSAVLAQQLGIAQEEVDMVIDRLTLPAAGQRILQRGASTDEIKTEFIRSRRHNRPLSLLVIEPAAGSLDIDLQRLIHQIQKEIGTRFLVASLAELINAEVRRTDIVVTRSPNGRFVVLCPETNSDGTSRLAERIQNSASEKLGIDMAFGISSFPDQAVTFEDLLQHAEFQLTHYFEMPANRESSLVNKKGSSR